MIEGGRSSQRGNAFFFAREYRKHCPSVLCIKHYVRLAWGAWLGTVCSRVLMSVVLTKGDRISHPTMSP